MKTNFLKHANAMYDIAKQVENDIISLMKENNIEYLDLQPCNNGGVSVYAMVFDYENSTFVERQIVAAKICNTDGKDELFLLHQPSFENSHFIVKWTLDDMKEKWEESEKDWNAAFDINSGIWDSFESSDIHATFTAYNLADSMDYIKVEK